MFWDHFPIVELDLPFEQFDALRGLRHPAYRYEYFDGKAVLSPRPWSGRAILRLDTEARPPTPESSARGRRIEPLAQDHWEQLPALLGAAHCFDVPFSLLAPSARTQATEACIEDVRLGREGELLLPACLVARHTDDDSRLVGAIIVTLVATDRYFAHTTGDSVTGPRPDQIPHLTWALVDAFEQRHGIGSQLLDACTESLRAMRFPTLASSFIIGNSAAMLWHWRNGFELLREHGRG